MDILRETETSLFSFAVLEKEVDFPPVQSDVWHTKTEGGTSMGHSTASGRTRAEAAFVPHELDIPRGVTPAQRKVLDTLKTQIDRARTNDFESWHEKYTGKTVEWTRQRWRSDPAGAERIIQTHREYYEQLRRGEGYINASGPTIHKLERLGLIKILHDSTGTGSYSHDTIKLLNY